MQHDQRSLEAYTGPQLARGRSADHVIANLKQAKADGLQPLARATGHGGAPCS